MLRAFVQEAGASLRTVTTLGLWLDNDGGSPVTLAVLSIAMGLLISKCPALTLFRLAKDLPPAFLALLGQSCPSLRVLEFTCPSPDQESLQQLLLLQPSLLPQVSTLKLTDCSEEYILSDMSINSSIHSVQLHDFCFVSETQWLSLPPKMQHLFCYTVEVGPPACSSIGSAALGSLLSLELEGGYDFLSLPLHAFAQILQAAPFLQLVKVRDDMRGKGLLIDCVLNNSTATATATDLALLHQKMGRLNTVQDIIFSINCSKRDASCNSLRPCIALLPMMTRVTRCEVRGLRPGELAPLMRLFPDVGELTLRGCDEVTDVELQELSGFGKQVTELRIIECSRLTPMGLYALCQCLPGMCSVVCHLCLRLDQAALDGCAALLKRQDLLMTLTAVTNLF